MTEFLYTVIKLIGVAVGIATMLFTVRNYGLYQRLTEFSKTDEYVKLNKLYIVDDSKITKEETKKIQAVLNKNKLDSQIRFSVPFLLVLYFFIDFAIPLLIEINP